MNTLAVPAHVAKDRVIQRLAEAEKALGQAVQIDQVKLVMDAAAAQEVFARRQQLGEDIIGYAHSIKVHALARLGELLASMSKARAGRPREIGSNSEPIISDRGAPTYAELGIDKKVAAVAQQLAAMPHETREAIAQREQTLSQARREIATPPPRQVGPPCNGLQFARIAIMKLDEIRDNDVERQEAFALVRRWLDARET